jgi:hypothetical protein
MRRALYAVQPCCILLVLAILLPQATLGAPAQLVGTDVLHSAIVTHSEKRQADLEILERVLSSLQASQRVESILGDSEKIRAAVAALSDEELDRLAQRGHQWERDLAAGALTNQQLTYIVIALAAAVLVLLIVS